MERPDYPTVAAAVERLMLAHTNEIRSGGTDELRAATENARAEAMTLIYAATSVEGETWVPDEDPTMPKKRRHGGS